MTIRCDNNLAPPRTPKACNLLTCPRPHDPRIYRPYVARNRDPILDVLRRVLPGQGLVLEVASGSGEHAAYFAAHLPALTWQPSDPDPEALASIAAHRAAAGTPNLLAPLQLDVSAPRWPVERADAMICNNMIHISPWSASEGLMAGAARTLPPGGVLYLYGPYKIDGRHTAPSNAAFDANAAGAKCRLGHPRSRRRRGIGGTQRLDVDGDRRNAGQ